MNQLYSRLKGVYQRRRSRRRIESSDAEEPKPTGKLDDNPSERESIHSEPREKTPTPPPPPPPVSLSPRNVPVNPPLAPPETVPPPLPSSQSVTPREMTIPRSSMRDIARPIRNHPRRPFLFNPNSTLVGFPRPSNFQPFSQTRRFFPRTVNMDYPIDDVFFEKNIPYPLALEINDMVERDRHNQTPLPQRMSLGRTPSGVRYIREIKRPKKQICYEIPEDDFYPGPIHYFIAFASPIDPMCISY